MIKLGDCIGAGLHVAEAVPCAIGFVAAHPGDSVGAISGAVNVGYDTDTIATMTGAVVGALYGADSFPEYYLSKLENANDLPIALLAKKITAIAEARIRKNLKV
jgi:ADP-ribosylglycohydrolase